MTSTWQEILAATDWSTLGHAYGDATDVPGWVEGATRADTVEESLYELWAAVLHQGSIYDATPPAMTALAAMLAQGESAADEQISWLLLMFADCVAAYEGIEPEDAESAETVNASRAALGRIAAMVRPLLAGDGDVAASAALLQTEVDGPVAAALTGRATHRPAGPVERACVAALVRGGAEPTGILADGEPGLRLAAALARIGSGGIDPEDITALIDNWALAAEVAPQIAFGVASVPEWLSAVNPAASAQVLDALPTPDEATITGLVDVVLSSRRSAPSAVRRLLEFAAHPEAEHGLMVTALRQLPPTEQVRDALVTVAAQVTEGSTATVGSSSFAVDLRADAALALLRAGDPRWANLLAEALASNPRARSLYVAGSPHGRSSLGYAFLAEAAPPSANLVGSLRQALTHPMPTAKENDQTGSLIDLLASWPADRVAEAVPTVRALLDAYPVAAAQALAAWGDTASIDQVRRRVASDGEARVLLALARLTGDPADFHRLLDVDLEYVESEVLTHWADRTDPRFLDWCRDLVGDSPATSDPDRADQVLALEILADHEAGITTANWDVLRGIIDGGRGPLRQAIALAAGWRAAGHLTDAQCADLETLLTDIVVAGRKDWSGPRAAASAEAAIGLVELGHPIPGTPARIKQILLRSLLDDVRSREVGLRFAACCATAPQKVRALLVGELTKLIERDARIDSLGDQAIEDEQLLVELRRIVPDLEAS